MSPPPFFVIIDTNVWFSERLLQTPIGSAALLAFTSSGAVIGVPEIVQREVELLMVSECEKATTGAGKYIRLLSHASGREVDFSPPTPDQIRAGLAARWQHLAGRVHRIPFSYDQANAALDRIMRHALPSAAQNEQFRDCCIWECAITLSKEAPVHLVTSDAAFFEAKDLRRGIAASLRDEASQRGQGVLVHSSLIELLTAVGSKTEDVKEDIISAEVIAGIAPEVRKIVAARGLIWELNSPDLMIRGYATPAPSVVAVSFYAKFELTAQEQQGPTKLERKATFFIEGSCSYNPNTKSVSSVDADKWSIVYDTGGKGTSVSLWDKNLMREILSDGSVETPS